MTKNDANRRLSTLKEKTRETLGAYTGLTSKQGKDKKIYYEGKKARQLSADAFRSNVSSQILAAYWLVTSLYPNSIAGKVKRQRQGTKRSAYTARREQSPPAESTGGDRQGPSPRKNDDADSSSSTNNKA